jgi:hypothetical protein
MSLVYGHRLFDVVLEFIIGPHESGTNPRTILPNPGGLGEKRKHPWIRRKLPRLVLYMGAELAGN